MERIDAINPQSDKENSSYNPYYPPQWAQDEEEHRITHRVEAADEAEHEQSEQQNGPLDQENANQAYDQVLFGKNDQDEEVGIYTRESVLKRFAEENEMAAKNAANLDEADKDMIRRLQARDREVRQHEQKHAAALGPYAGSVSFNYQMGPDGKTYAIGGTTEVNTGKEATPEATAQKARTIQRAALAGGDASPADIKVAQQMQQMAREAQAN